MARTPILTREQIKDADARYQAGDTYEAIAKSYGVHRMSLWRGRRSVDLDPHASDHRGIRIQRTTIQKHWITAAQAAVILGISRRSVCELCRRGRIFGALKMGAGAGAVWLMPKSSVVGRAGESVEK